MLGITRSTAFTALGWILLAGGWIRVAANGTMPTWPMALTPVLVGGVAAVLTAMWIRHNITIHRRLGARHAAAMVTSHYGRDPLGRRIVGGHAPATWKQVYVHSTSRRKCYMVVE